MLFSVNNEDVLKRYFNLEKKNNLLEPKEGLILGNMFFDMYEPYKNYKPRELVATTEKEKLMLKIRELSLKSKPSNYWQKELKKYNKFVR